MAKWHNMASETAEAPSFLLLPTRYSGRCCQIRVVEAQGGAKGFPGSV